MRFLGTTVYFWKAPADGLSLLKPAQCLYIILQSDLISNVGDEQRRSLRNNPLSNLELINILPHLHNLARYIKTKDIWII